MVINTRFGHPPPKSICGIDMTRQQTSLMQFHTGHQCASICGTESSKCFEMTASGSAPTVIIFNNLGGLYRWPCSGKYKNREQIQTNRTVIFLIESLICTFNKAVEIVLLLSRTLCFRFYVGSWEEGTVGIRQKGFKWLGTVRRQKNNAT